MTRDEERLVRFERITEGPMLVLAVVFTALIVAPAVVVLSDSQTRTLEIADWLLWAVFAFEFGTRLYLAPARLPYARQHWYDVALVALPFLRPLRVARGLRLARAAVALFRAAGEVRNVLKRRAVGYPMGGALTVCVAIALAMPLAERGAEGSTIHTVGDGLWWGAVTITTVGYGDVAPVTPLGRGLALALMLVGIASFGIATASIAAYFVEEREVVDQRELLEALRAIESRLAVLEGTQAAEPLDGPSAARTSS